MTDDRSREEGRPDDGGPPPLLGDGYFLSFLGSSAGFTYVMLQGPWLFS
jgi:hypothetical protein